MKEHSNEDGKRVKFIEVVEKELLSNHNGNFARYMAHPLEYQRKVA
jgi:hypothetical protein